MKYNKNNFREKVAVTYINNGVETRSRLFNHESIGPIQVFIDSRPRVTGVITRTEIESKAAINGLRKAASQHIDISFMEKTAEMNRTQNKPKK